MRENAKFFSEKQRKRAKISQKTLHLFREKSAFFAKSVHFSRRLRYVLPRIFLLNFAKTDFAKPKMMFRPWLGHGKESGRSRSIVSSTPFTAMSHLPQKSVRGHFFDISESRQIVEEKEENF